MSPQELHNMIQVIKGLPDNFLVRILTAATNELLKRAQRELRRLKDLTEKP